MNNLDGMGERVLFEIPVYAVSKEDLMTKYRMKAEKIRSENRIIDESLITRAIEIETYPQRLWSYNHIVGFIRISIDFRDVFFDIFRPTPKIERYIWDSTAKKFLYNILANGAHLCIDYNLSNTEIASCISDELEFVIKRHFPKRCYVDRDAFNNINKHIDYRALLEET